MTNWTKLLSTQNNRAAHAALLVALITSLVFACTTKPARFAHRAHLGIECGAPNQPSCLTCVSCHSQLVNASPSSHPTNTNCKECHQKDTNAVFASLHQPKSLAAELANQIDFNHAQHLAMAEIGGQCITCHGGLVSEAGGATFPPMSTCFNCHNHQEQWDTGKCAPCHKQADLKQLFPRTYLRHGAGWDKKHGLAAATTVTQCAQCHTSASCDDCHNVTEGLKVEVKHATNIERDFTHPADFISRHAIDAASNPATCLSCHRVETCESCHQQRGVSALSASAMNPHPPGWMGSNSNAQNHHGRAARRDILSCASCHDRGPQTNCVGCHQVGGPGGNPHPSGWQSEQTPTDEMCRYCHEDSR